MIDDRHPLSPGFAPLQTDGADAICVAGDLSADRLEVSGKRILLVEDDESLRQCVRMMLECAGHQVTEASNGAEAFNLFNIGEFDVVVTDFEMPVMEGNKLAIGIKLLAPSVPILMITAAERARRDARNPVDALLRKPFTATELHCALAEILSTRAELALPSLIVESR